MLSVKLRLVQEKLQPLACLPLKKIRTEEATIQALVIAPTRELAVQSQEELFRFGRSKESKSVQYMADQALKNKLRLLNLVPISWWELQVASWT